MPDLTSHAGWVHSADDLLAALQPHRTTSGALYRVPGRPSWSGEQSDGLEGFARSFLLLAFRVAGTGGASSGALLEDYREGLVAGVRQGHADSWPRIVDRGQALVEAASIAIGLHLTRPWLWDALSEAEQGLIAAWLAPSAGVSTPDNNWVLFPVIVQEFLASVGLPADRGRIASGLARLEDWYDGNGWYRDGAGQNFDYYNAWALHLYPTMWTMLREGTAPDEALERRAGYGERLARFLPQHLLFFGRDGSPVFQGRSLSYRFAALAPLWVDQYAGFGIVEPGVARDLAARTLGFFVDGGALNEGRLTSGWLGEFPPMIQPYSGPASPYWASKGFLGLALGPDHPVWNDPPREAADERRDVVVVAKEPGFLLARTGADGIARIVNHGSDNHPPLVGLDDPQYGRLAFSSATAPSFDPDPVDSHVALVDEAGVASRRGGIVREQAAAGTLASSHVPLWADQSAGVGLRILTASTAVGPHVVQAHVISSERDREFAVRVGGWAVASDLPPVASEASQGCTVTAAWGTRSNAGDGALGARVAPSSEGAREGEARLAPPSDGGRTLASRLVIVHGEATPAVHRATGTSPLGTEVAVPVLVARHSGRRTVLVTVSTLTGSDPVDPPRVLTALVDDKLIVEVDGAATIRLPMAR
ncbi:hypothetical protein BW730_15005 [Tessaracoccus aquimaris]|uniref:DUF2264 domain-containing protein n=1 Tax=Tessaracoccus aquimaris TaxID=1332264 RepID=A0A1Q2CR77_9ACTN|nr:DUF2264 domain-containing protein [Tessaracoccus aquimaris]AQP48616.1 hypothetical protein BW730_15005 [Tessaracoccus aquimaris]